MRPSAEKVAWDVNPKRRRTAEMTVLIAHGVSNVRKSKVSDLWDC